MTASYDLTLFALDDIDEAADDIDDAAQAAVWVQTIHDGLEQLGQMSGLGHRRTDITDQDVFFWRWNRWAVIYQKRTPILIVRVLPWGRLTSSPWLGAGW